MMQVEPLMYGKCGCRKVWVAVRICRLYHPFKEMRLASRTTMLDTVDCLTAREQVRVLPLASLLNKKLMGGMKAF